jgi:hypothetical protein
VGKVEHRLFQIGGHHALPLPADVKVLILLDSLIQAAVAQALVECHAFFILAEDLFRLFLDVDVDRLLSYSPNMLCT